MRRSKGMHRRSALTLLGGISELVDARTGGTHFVREDAVAAGRRTGRYLAVCGAMVLAASLLAPAQTYCRSCIQGIGR